MANRSYLSSDLTSAEFPQTHRLLSEGLVQGVAPGFIAGVWDQRDPESFKIAAVGNRRQIPSILPMEPQTWIDVASLSKVIATAPLFARLVEKGWVRWEDSLVEFFPDHPARDVTLAHLLAHTAGFPAWLPYWEGLRNLAQGNPLYEWSIRDRQDLMRRAVLGTPQEVPAGTRTLYSDVSYLLLGFVIEKITDMPLDRAVKRHLWQPMGVQGAQYFRVQAAPSASPLFDAAATEHSAWRGGILQGQVHDDNCWAMGGYGGHAGVFAQAEGVLKIASQMMSGFFSQAVFDKLTHRVVPPLGPAGCERTMGWDTPNQTSSTLGTKFSRHSIGHLGYTGCALWLDLEHRVAVCLLSNRVHPSRENEQIKAFRPRFFDALASDLGF